MEERNNVLSFKACPEEYIVIVCLHHPSAFSVRNKDVVSLMKVKHTFHFLLEYALPPSLWGSSVKGLSYLFLKVFLFASKQRSVHCVREK